MAADCRSPVMRPEASNPIQVRARMGIARLRLAMTAPSRLPTFHPIALHGKTDLALRAVCDQTPHEAPQTLLSVPPWAGSVRSVLSGLLDCWRREARTPKPLTQPDSACLTAFDAVEMVGVPRIDCCGANPYLPMDAIGRQAMLHGFISYSHENHVIAESAASLCGNGGRGHVKFWVDKSLTAGTKWSRKSKTGSRTRESSSWRFRRSSTSQLHPARGMPLIQTRVAACNGLVVPLQLQGACFALARRIQAVPVQG